MRNENEATDVRNQAAVAIGKSRDTEAVSTLRRLHETVMNREVKDEILRMLFKRSKARRSNS